MHVFTKRTRANPVPRARGRNRTALPEMNLPPPSVLFNFNFFFCGNGYFRLLAWVGARVRGGWIGVAGPWLGGWCSWVGYP